MLLLHASSTKTNCQRHTQDTKQGYVPTAGLLLQVKSVTGHTNSTSFNETHKLSQGKYSRYRILGACPAPTDSSQLQAAGRLGLPLQLLWALPHMFSQPLPQAHWLCCEKRGGWRRLAGREQPLQIQTHRHGTGNVHTTLTHVSLHTRLKRHICGVCTHKHTHARRLPPPPFFFFLLCSCFTLQSCKQCTPGI